MATPEINPLGAASPLVTSQPLAVAASSGGCDHCDTFGGRKTYDGQACLPIDGRVVCVDWCIHQLVAALNAGGVRTVACCCGHGQIPGRIDLADGRTLTITRPNAASQTAAPKTAQPKS